MSYLFTKFISADLVFGPDTIEPDKGGIAGYALLLLYNETKDSRYLNQAIQNAKVLLENMETGRKLVFVVSETRKLDTCTLAL